MNVVKEPFNLICAPLTYIINLSLNFGVVPQEIKIARVIPLFKSGDKSLFTNYRPVSVLPVFSKFLERIVYNRLTRGYLPASAGKANSFIFCGMCLFRSSFIILEV